MKNLKRIDSLRRQELEKRCIESSRWRQDLKEAASQIVRALVEEELEPLAVSEASVHRPRRGRLWVAYFTSATGGQVSKSTGLADRDEALALAREWETAARAQREKLNRITRRTSHRVGPAGSRAGGGLTQRETAVVMKMSERSIRAIERLALWKLRHHPLLQELWDEYVSGELDEEHWNLDPREIAALFDAARTTEEWHVIQKILRMIGW